MIADTFFFIKWLDSGGDTEELLDVVNSKAVIPPDDVDILELKRGQMQSVV